MKVTKIEENKYKYTFTNANKTGVDEDSDKYLYDRGKTIGFRKDKKLHKFVGLRDCYSKQLELTLKSVIIDGSEKIAANRVNFSDIALSGETVNHTINSFEFENRINVNNYKNILKVSDEFEEISITYEVHISDDSMVFSNQTLSRKTKKLFSQTPEGKFIITDKYNGLELFVFDTPVVYANDNKRLDIIITHELYEEDGKYYYKKNISNNKTASDKYPIYIDVNIIFNNAYWNEDYSYNNDADVDTMWAKVLSGARLDDDQGSSTVFIWTRTYTGGGYSGELTRPIFEFFTTPITDDVVEAKIRLTTYGDPNFKLSLSKAEPGEDWDNPNPSYVVNGLDYFYPITGGTVEIDIPVEDWDGPFMLRSYDYDVLGITPTIDTDNTSVSIFSEELEITVLTPPSITGTTSYEFPVTSSGFGVMRNYGPTVDDIVNNPSYNLFGIISNTNPASSDGYAVSHISNFTLKTLYRTYMSFSTGLLDDLTSVVLKSVKLVLKNVGFSDIDISVCRSYQSFPLHNSDWNNVFNSEFGTYSGITSDETFEIDLIPTILNSDSSVRTSIVLRSTEYDVGLDDSEIPYFAAYTGIDFSNSYLEVTYDPYLISGANNVKAYKGQSVVLMADKNTPNGEIVWAADSGFTNYILGTGNTITVDTTNFADGAIIYACIMEPYGYIVSGEVFGVTLELVDLEYNGFPDRNFNVHDVDIDAVYFKYHKCLSGVTYAYARELDDVYEQDLEVSDGEGLGSYNMYNEFDIIDEFFSNSHEVEVVGKLDEINLSVSQKKIDDVVIHEGTRVLLYSTIPSEDDGVYVADFNLMLHKTNELSDADTAFRYKAHVGAGTYMDYEFHTQYYTVSGTTEEEDFDFLDPTIYGETVIDFLEYSELLYDANLFT